MAHSEEDRKGLGRRLAAARNVAGLTLQAVSDALTAKGHAIGKAAIGHWESGTNVPDAIWLRRLAKLYGTTVDALVGDGVASLEAVQLATEYDRLAQPQKRSLRAVVNAFIEQARQEIVVAAPAPTPHFVMEPSAAQKKYNQLHAEAKNRQKKPTVKKKAA